MIPAVEFGGFRIHCLTDSFFRLDAGSIFGIVPKTIWSRSWQADDRNRLRLAVRCLLVEANDRWILIETGMGDKWDDKLKQIYAFERVSTLDEQLQQLGIEPEDIRIVINSHLHFDHAGGNTKKQNGEWIPAFPNARVVCQRGEYEMATHLNERTKGSYRIDDYLSLEKNGLFDFINGDATVHPGVRVVRSGGHTPYHQCVWLESEAGKSLFLGDLVPTRANLGFPYITAFDLEPLVTLEKKKEYLTQAASEDAFVFFSHDPEVAYAKLQLQNGRIELKS
jgi:glyoxylase-like metal-dependent hydrolase (beta-lactamase superfamily II)